MKKFLLIIFLFTISCTPSVPNSDSVKYFRNIFGKDIGDAFPGSYSFIINTDSKTTSIYGKEKYHSQYLKKDGSGFTTFNKVHENFSIYYNFNLDNLYLINALPTTILTTSCYSSKGAKLGTFILKNNFKGLKSNIQDYYRLCKGAKNNEEVYLINSYIDIIGDTYYLKYPMKLVK